MILRLVHLWLQNISFPAKAQHGYTCLEDMGLAQHGGLVPGTAGPESHNLLKNGRNINHIQRLYLF